MSEQPIETIEAVETPVETPETPVDASENTEAKAVVPPNKLFVGNVFYKTKKFELEELFKDFAVTNIQIPMRRLTSEGRTFTRPRGYVFVTFKEGEDLDKIIEKFNNSEFKGRNIYVLYPNPQIIGEEKVAEEKKDEEKTEKVKKDKKKKEVKPKVKVPFDESKKSSTTLHLKNLDFGIRSKDLKEFFESKGESIDWISVPFANLPKPVLKKLQAKGKTIERKNRGFAFVKLILNDNETLQEKVDKYSGVEFKERAMIVSAAYDVKQPETKSLSPESEEKTETETQA